MDRVRLLRFVLSKVCFSVIVPLFNRPEEIQELLERLTHQSFRTLRSSWSKTEAIGMPGTSCSVSRAGWMSIISGRRTPDRGLQGISGLNAPKEIGLSSSIPIVSSPLQYLEIVDAHLRANPGIDVYGGPDTAHTSFPPFQKAISHAMTSPLTTRGIRGRVRNVPMPKG